MFGFFRCFPCCSADTQVVPAASVRIPAEVELKIAGEKKATAGANGIEARGRENKNNQGAAAVKRSPRAPENYRTYYEEEGYLPPVASDAVEDSKDESSVSVTGSSAAGLKNLGSIKSDKDPHNFEVQVRDASAMNEPINAGNVRTSSSPYTDPRNLESLINEERLKKLDKLVKSIIPQISKPSGQNPLHIKGVPALRR